MATTTLAAATVAQAREALAPLIGSGRWVTAREAATALALAFPGRTATARRHIWNAVRDDPAAGIQRDGQSYRWPG